MPGNTQRCETPAGLQDCAFKTRVLPGEFNASWALSSDTKI